MGELRIQIPPGYGEDYVQSCLESEKQRMPGCKFDCIAQEHDGRHRYVVFRYYVPSEEPVAVASRTRRIAVVIACLILLAFFIAPLFMSRIPW
jgi:hypothetical protein